MGDGIMKSVASINCLVGVTVTVAVLTFAIATLPTTLAFNSNQSYRELGNSRFRGGVSMSLFRKAGGYPSMPPLSNSTSSSFSGNIFKVLKRDIYPTATFECDGENCTAIDQHFMGVALQQARRAWDRGEVPIGAVLVRECNHDATDDESNATAVVDGNMQQSTRRRTFQILSKAHNRVETNIDATAHAEMLVLRRGAASIQNWRYPPNSRLYTTLEPCPMCLASIQAFRIDHVIYGAPDNRLGAVKTHMDLLSVAKHPYHEVKSVTGGVREEECGDIMVRFFRERRRKKKEARDSGRQLLMLPRKRDDVDIKQPSVFSRLKRLLRLERK